MEMKEELDPAQVEQERTSPLKRLAKLLQVVLIMCLMVMAGFCTYLLLDFAGETLAAPVNTAIDQQVEPSLAQNQEAAAAAQELEHLYAIGETTEEKTTQEIARLRSQVVRIETELGQGSGVVIHKEGYIITNWHVVEEEAAVQIYFENHSDQGLTADLLTYDEEKDLALLKLKELPEGIEIEAIPISDMSQIEVGDKIVTIGSPRGLMNTVSEGIISAMRTEDETSYVQITAPLSPGSSGGALLNTMGQLVGINTFKIEESENINFAISSTEVQVFLDAYQQ